MCKIKHNDEVIYSVSHSSPEEAEHEFNYQFILMDPFINPFIDVEESDD